MPLFLVIAEGITRLILESDIAGIPVGNTTHKLSQFADDTQLLLKGYYEIPKVWPLPDQYERASGVRANAQKCRNPVRITQTRHGPTRPHTERSHYPLGQT